MKPLNLILLFVCCFFTWGFSQDIPAFEKINLQVNSIKKVKALNNASEDLWLIGDYSKSTTYAQKAPEVAKKINDKKGEAMALIS